MLQDSEKIREAIDQKYDRSFEKIYIICEEQLSHAAILSKDGLLPREFSLRSVATVLKETYLMQRLARGMSQGKYTHEIIEENSQFIEALTAVEAGLNENVIEGRIKVLPKL